MNKQKIKDFLKCYHMADYEIIEMMSEEERCTYLVKFSNHLYAMNKKLSHYFRHQPLVAKEAFLSYINKKKNEINPILAREIKGYLKEKEESKFISDEEVSKHKFMKRAEKVLRWMKAGEDSPIPPFDYLDAFFLLQDYSPKKAEQLLSSKYPRKDYLPFYITLRKYDNEVVHGERSSREELLSKRHIIMANGVPRERFSKEEREEFVEIMKEYGLPSEEIFLSIFEKRTMATEAFDLFQTGDISFLEVKAFQEKRVLSDSQTEDYAIGYYYSYATPLEQEEFREMAKRTEPSEEMTLLFPKMTNFMRVFQEDEKKPFQK